MEAVRKHAVVEQDGEVRIGGLPYKKGDYVEVTLLKEQPRAKRGMTAAELLASPLVGMWADRTDIRDSSEFAHELREKAQRRHSLGIRPDHTT